jgi:predicted secreted protein
VDHHIAISVAGKEKVIRSIQRLMAIEIAAALARDVRRPGFSKEGLRQCFLKSELGDGASLATALEDAYVSLFAQA